MKSVETILDTGQPGVATVADSTRANIDGADFCISNQLVDSLGILE